MFRHTSCALPLLGVPWNDLGADSLPTFLELAHPSCRVKRWIMRAPFSHPSFSAVG